MDRAFYMRATQAFEAVVDLPAEEQGARVRELVGNEPELVEFVLAMLVSDAEDDLLVDRPVEEGVGRVLARDLGKEALPERIGNFQVLGLLGEGGMGVVFEAQEQHPRRLVAIKRLHTWLETPTQQVQFTVETQAMAQLQHPNIPRVLAAGEEDGRPYLVMERVEGVPLSAWKAPLPTRVRVLLAIGRAVEHAHARGVIHRDLKPANVLVDAQDHPFVLDFGVASLVGSAAAMGSGGTLAYMGRGQLAGEPPSERDDVCALGVLAYELFAGRLPWQGPQDTLEAARASRVRPVPPLGLADGWLRGDLEAVVRHALSPDGYPDARSFCQDLEAVLVYRPVRARQPTVGYRLRAALRRHERELLAALLTVVGTALLAAFGWGVGAALEHKARARVEARAEERRAAAQAREVALTGEGRVDLADAVFLAFVDDPDHRGTVALGQAWLERAGRLASQGRADEELDAWASGYTAASGPEQKQRALLGLGQALRARWAWSGISAALDPWGEGPPSPIRDEARYLGGDLADHPAWGRLAHGRRLVGAAADYPLNHPGNALLRWHAGERRVTVLGSDLEPAAVLSLPETTGHFQYLHLLAPGLFLGLTTDQDLAGSILRRDAHLLEETQPGELQVTWTGEGFVSQNAVAADLDADGRVEVYLPNGASTRGLLRLERDDEGWVGSMPHPETDAQNSDVTSLLGFEGGLLAGLGPWRTYSLWSYVAAGEGLQRVASRQLGVVDHLSAIRGPGGQRRVALDTVSTTPNPAMFGGDGLAAPVGLYVVDPDLQVVSFLAPELPLAGTASWTLRSVADLSGDGIEDLVLQTRFQGEAVLLLVQQDARGELHPTLVGGLGAIGTTDTDGDGVAELVVRRGDEAWVLGSGDEALPRWEAMAPAPVQPLLEPQRCNDLLRMGLAGAAASCAERSALLAPRVETLRWAARLRADEGQEAQALADWESLLQLAPTDAEGLRERAALLTSTHEWEEAVKAWGRVGGEEAERVLSWLRPQAGPLDRTTWEFVQPLDPAWNIQDPVAVRLLRARSVLRLHAFSGQVGLAGVSLEGTGPRVEVEARVELRSAEEASGLALRVEDGEGRVQAIVRVGFSAGGGASNRTLSCFATRGLGDATRPAVPSELATWNESLRMRLVLVPATGEVLCQVLGEDGPLLEGRQRSGTAWDASRLRLVFYGSTQLYDSPMLLEADLDSLTLKGVRPVPSGGDPGLLALASAEPGRALDLLGLDQSVALAAALWESGRADEAAALLARAPDTTDLQHLVRLADASLSRRLLEALGARYLTLFRDAWAGDAYHWANGHAAQELLVVPLERLDAGSPVSRQLMVWRARALLDDGQESLARQVLQAVLSAPSDDEVGEEARVLLGRLGP